MTLRSRLLLSALVLSLATTVVLALIVRASWQQAEENRFRQELDQALQDIDSRLGGAAAGIRTSLTPLCEHDPIVDSALVGLKSGTLPSRILSLRARVVELGRALGLDELALVTSDGQLLAGGGSRELPEGRELSLLAQERAEKPGVRREGEFAFEGACLKKEGRVWVALLGAKHVSPVLLEAGKAHGLRLTLIDDSQSAPNEPTQAELHRAELPLRFLPGTRLVAERSRVTLTANLDALDAQVLTATFSALGGAFLLAFFLSRGLARPVIRFAEQTREAVQGTVQELPVTGGPELEQAARAFNATLADLKALRDRLKVTERIAARREVARQIAHEIKNPLSPIRTSIETLRKMKERGLPEFDAYFLETTATVLSEVSRISTMVGHFAEYARLPSPSPTSFVLEDLLTQMVDLHQGLGAQVVLRSDSRTHEVEADRAQLSQVLTNLIKNAIEATSDQPDGLVEVSVEEKPGTEGSVLLISVADSGRGLSLGQAARIFEPYVTTKKDGTGLGLPISHRIAVEHGGDLTYTTSKGGGAQFVLTLPRSGPPKLAEPAE